MVTGWRKGASDLLAMLARNLGSATQSWRGWEMLLACLFRWVTVSFDWQLRGDGPPPLGHNSLERSFPHMNLLGGKSRSEMSDVVSCSAFQGLADFWNNYVFICYIPLGQIPETLNGYFLKIIFTIMVVCLGNRFTELPTPPFWKWNSIPFRFIM